MDTPVIEAPEPETIAASAPAVVPETAVVDHASTPVPAKTPAISKKKASSEPKVDLFAAARYAKKMRRKKAHRATLKGSHTNG